MNHFGQLLLYGNIFLLALLAWILSYVGTVVSSNSPKSRPWASRAAFVAFGWFVLQYLVSHQRPAEDELLAMTIRGLIAAWLTFAIALIILPAIFGAHSLWKSFHVRLQTAAAARKAKRERVRAEKRQERASKARQRVWERTAPEREQAERLAQEKSDIERQQRQLTAKRREDALAKLELMFSLFAPDIKGRFTRAMFDEFVKKYMSDNRSPDEIEERGRQLEAILKQHRDSVSPVKKHQNMQSLAEWFLAEKERLEGLTLDPMLKDEFLAILNERYAELTQRMLQQMEP